MQIGAPFNPYRVFQGVFAPYWLLEHRGISTGAKLCYIRLLGYAGKDARCYPSLETLGSGLGVSDRQARDYVKELERAGLIAIEQRGLRKTNVYLFLWTSELDTLFHSVPDGSQGSDSGSQSPAGPLPVADLTSAPDRNDCSAPDRKPISAPERNSCSGLDRKHPSGPKGIYSSGIIPSESSSSEACLAPHGAGKRRRTSSPEEPAGEKSEYASQPKNPASEMIVEWARKRKIQRLRSDRQVGFPETERLAEWVAILAARGITSEDRMFPVLDAARLAADRCGPWRNWAYLTLQIQLAAEHWETARAPLVLEPATGPALPAENPEDIWAKAKTRIRTQIPETAYLNWFSCTRQLRSCGSHLEVAVPDEPTRAYISEEYHHLAGAALAELGINRVQFLVSAPCDRPEGTPDSSSKQLSLSVCCEGTG